jgi:hypothetical protein
MDFLKGYIKEDWVKEIDEDNLTYINATFIDVKYREKESDVIYKLRLKDREVIFYILIPPAGGQARRSQAPTTRCRSVCWYI